MSKEYKEATGIVIRLEWLEEWQKDLTPSEIGEAVLALADYQRSGIEYGGDNRVIKVMLKNCYKCIDYDLEQYDHKAKRLPQKERLKKEEFFEKKLELGNKYTFAQMGQDMGTSKSTAQRDYVKWLAQREKEGAPIIRNTYTSNAEEEIQIQIQTGTSHGPDFVPKSSQFSQMGKSVPNGKNLSQNAFLGRALTEEELERYVHMYNELDVYMYSHSGPEMDEVGDLLDNGCYFNNPEAKLVQMPQEELDRLEGYYNKYCYGL